MPGWTRAYDYAETSLIEDGSGGAPLKTSNRLSRTTLSPNGANPHVEPYQHDAHGNMVRMPHLGGGLPGPNMHWDYKDQLRQTDLGGGGAAYYVYDASGQRVRKVWEKAPGLTEERIYLGGFEIFRKHGGPIGANTATLERETLHVMDDKQRIALVETRTLDTAGNDQAPRQLIRYQFGNHLGSASLELDEQAQIISYEEYAPYGSSTYQAVRSQTETAKRYRYTGKERDEESGLYYHGARYYAPWLGRWMSPDPMGLIAGLGLYRYAHSDPVGYLDSSGHNPEESDNEAVVRQPYTSSLLSLDYSNICGGSKCITDEEIYSSLEQSRAEDRAATARADALRAERATLRSQTIKGLEADVERTQRGTRQHRYARERLEAFKATGHDPGPRRNYDGGPAPVNITAAVVGGSLAAGFVVLATWKALLLSALLAGSTSEGGFSGCGGIAGLGGGAIRTGAEKVGAALLRAEATQMNVLEVQGVSRTITAATGEETFVHTTMRASGAHTSQSAAVNIAEKNAINLSPGGQVGQWGEGAYAFEGTLAGESGSQTMVQFGVPKGTAIERIAIPGERTIVRIVPAEGNALSITSPVTNLSEAEMKAATEWLRKIQSLL